MASELLKTFRRIEQDRQSCIYNLNSINIKTDKDSSLTTIAAKILEKGEPHKFEDDPLIWKRPEEWPDTKELLLNAPAVSGYTPFALFLLHDNRPNIALKISAKSSQGNLTRDCYYLSDGTLIEQPSGTSTTTITHTWDASKDIPTTLGYNLRYVIVYANNNRFNNTSNLRLMGDSGDNGGIGISLLEMVYNPIFGRVYWRIPEYVNSSTYVLNAYRIHILKGLDGSDFCSCNSSALYHSLKEIYIEQDGEFIWSYGPLSAGLNHFKYNTRLIAPNIESFSKTTTTTTTPYFLQVYAPNLKELKATGNNTTFYTKNLYAPKLQKVLNNTMLGYGNIQKLPLLRDISNYVYLSESVSTVYSNNLFSNINATDISSIPGSLSGTCVYNKYIEKLSLTSILVSDSRHRIILPNLKEITLETVFNDDNLSELIIGNGFKSNLNLSLVKYLTTLNMLDILRKLADVTNEEATYTLTLNSLVKSQLSEEELAIATNKGWIIK